MAGYWAKKGWGNEELQWYTGDQPKTSPTDGLGSLVITAREAEAAGLTCWYGPCRYTSARLLTSGLFELTYGRIEARLKVPPRAPDCGPRSGCWGRTSGRSAGPHRARSM